MILYNFLHKKYSNFKSKGIVLLKSIKLLIDSDPKLFCLLCITVASSAILPVIAIKTSADIINYIISSSEISDIYISLVIWGLVLFIHDLVSPLIVFLQSSLGDRAVFFINKSIIEKSNSLIGLEHFENSKFYDDLQIISTHAYSKPINLLVTIIGTFRDLCIIIYCISLLFFNISFFSLVILFCIIFHTNVATKIQSDMWVESLNRSSRSRMMSYISSLSVNPLYAKEIRLFSIGGYLYKKYSALFKEIYSSMLKLRLKLIILPILPSFILLSGNIIVLHNTIKLIMAGTLKIGVISIIIQCFMQLHNSVLSFSEQNGWISGHLLFFEKYFNFLSKVDISVSSKVSANNIIKDLKINSIRFENISFSYPDGRPALKNINFEIFNTDKLAIVGANGSGKTTLVKLICGMYSPSSGRIFINNLPIENYDISLLRNLIAPVFQDFGAYALPIKDNIIMGSEYVSQRLDYVINEVNADFIHKLPNSVGQQLGKMFGGTDLSIGQWQKIAIARAIYKGGDLFIFDEPTASLDPISEHEVFELFTKVCEDKMTIFVTHRLASVNIATKILLLDNGEQIAFDSHNNLLTHNHLYRKMFETQSSKFLNLIKKN